MQSWHCTGGPVHFILFGSFLNAGHSSTEIKLPIKLYIELSIAWALMVCDLILNVVFSIFGRDFFALMVILACIV